MLKGIWRTKRRLGISEFLNICEEESGQDLDWFFDQWVNSNKFLSYDISSQKSDKLGSRYRSEIEVKCLGNLKMPVPVAGGSHLCRTERRLPMAIEKVGVYRKWLGSAPKNKNGKPIPESERPRKRRHRWIARWYGSNGQRYGKVFETRKEAQDYTSALQKRVCLGKADKPKKLTLHEFRVEHEQVMRGQVAYATLDDQRRALRFFENFIGGSVLLLKIKPRHAEAFVAHRLSTVPSVSTVNKDIRTLQRIFNLAITPRGYLPEGQNPFVKIKKRKTTENKIRYVEIKEYRALANKVKNL